METSPLKVAAACKEILSEEDCQDIAALELQEAIGLAFALLMDNGIDDPESYLKEKDVLE